MTKRAAEDTMEDFFSGKLDSKRRELGLLSEKKTIELGFGKGIGNSRGSYNQYVDILEEQNTKGNGFISLGNEKDVFEADMEGNDIFYMSNSSDKFVKGEVPYLLILYNNIIKPVNIKLMWRDSDGDTISEQAYLIPTPSDHRYHWWEKYSTLFIGPEDLDQGNYTVDIITEEIVGTTDNMKIRTLSSKLDFSVE